MVTALTSEGRLTPSGTVKTEVEILTSLAAKHSCDSETNIMDNMDIAFILSERQSGGTAAIEKRLRRDWKADGRLLIYS
jgi:hypothetical protein